MPRCLVIHPSDNVGIVVNGDAKEGETVVVDGVPHRPLKLKAAIPAGHKVALRTIGADEPVLKYGQVIGFGTRRILPGEHVHVHNLRFRPNVRFSRREAPTARPVEGLPATFPGFEREDGRVGVRNYVAVVSTVNCSATVAKRVAERFRGRSLGGGVDGVVPVTYGGGCAIATGGLSYRVLARTLSGWLDHPNVVGALVIGLGCEEMGCGRVRTALPLSAVRGRRIESFDIQDAGGTEEAIRTGVRKVEEILASLPAFRRVPVPVSALRVALNCGGSDALSGVTANPALGAASDMLVSLGGGVALAEVPECHGADAALAGRCVRREDRAKLKRIFRWWLGYARRNGVDMDCNLAPGNIAGGISTILEKSLGAVAKAGSTPLREVLEYAEPITQPGFVFMDTPGFDPVSVTGLVAGGCQLVAFTTGRGSVYGCSIAPTLKIATNTALFRKMSGDMDVDAGRVLDGSTVEDVGREIYLRLVETAGGGRTSSERNGIGTEEFVPWAVGETL